jgi:hypothetical protein
MYVSYANVFDPCEESGISNLLIERMFKHNVFDPTHRFQGYKMMCLSNAFGEYDVVILYLTQHILDATLFNNIRLSTISARVWRLRILRLASHVCTSSKLYVLQPDSRNAGMLHP